MEITLRKTAEKTAHHPTWRAHGGTAVKYALLTLTALVQVFVVQRRVHYS